MIAAAPTILAVETDAAWVVVLAVSLVTAPAALLLRRAIGRPGGIASGMLLGLPLLLPLVAAAAFQGALLPEIAVLRPARDVFTHGTRDLLHLLYFHDGEAVTPYVTWGTAHNWVLLAGLGMSSFMLLRRAVGVVLLRAMVRRCRRPDEETAAALDELATKLARRAGCARVPEILLLPAAATGAFTVGAFKSRILISESLLARLDDDELEAVIAHEIAHVSARDTQVVFVSGFLRDTVAWNPVAHLAYRTLVDDREREADRRAAALTGKPLAVASSLVKMCDLIKHRKRGALRSALAFLRPRGRVARRVSHLLDVADGRAVAAGDRRLPYLAAACLVVALGLQSAASLTADRGAFAIVWGAPRIDTAADTYAPKAAAVAGEERAKRDDKDKKKKKKKKARRAELESPQRDIAVLPSFHAEDIEVWLSEMERLAAEGVTPATLQWEARRDWEAVPIRCTVGSLCIYRVDGI